MKNDLLVSIIIPTYNSSVTFEKTLCSIFRQSYRNVEVIVVDGGSTDSTINIIVKYQDRIKHWISEKDDGVYDAMNKGILLAGGEYVFFMGSDDIMTHNGLCDIMSEVNGIEDKMIVFDVFVEGKKKRTGPKFFNSHPMIHHQAVLFNLKNIKKDKIVYDLRYDIHSDYDFICRYYYKYGYIYYPVVVCVFSVGGLSSSGLSVRKKVYELLTVYFNNHGEIFSGGWFYIIMRSFWHWFRYNIMGNESEAKK